MKLTVWNWIEKLAAIDPEAARELVKLVENGLVLNIDTYPTVSAFLLGSFWWRKTPQGHRYWQRVQEFVRAAEHAMEVGA